MCQEANMPQDEEEAKKSQEDNKKTDSDKNW